MYTSAAEIIKRELARTQLPAKAILKIEKTDGEQVTPLPNWTYEPPVTFEKQKKEDTNSDK